MKKTLSEGNQRKNNTLRKRLLEIGEKELDLKPDLQTDGLLTSSTHYMFFMFQKIKLPAHNIKLSSLSISIRIISILL